MKWLVVFVALASAGPAAAQTHAPDVEARLATLIGDWTIAGQESTYRETCAWFDNKSFVVCNSSDSGDGSRSQSVLGYSKAKERFTYQNFGSGGTSRYEWGFPYRERGIVYTDERMSAGKLSRMTTIVELESDGRLHFVQERSTEGRPFEKIVDFHYIRRK